MKRSILTLLALTGVFVAATAAEPEWMTDLNAARKRAAKEGRHILVNFSGSDWCHWCQKLDSEVFQKEAFEKYACENLVLVLVDSPRRTKPSAEAKRRNRKLLQEFGVQGFPTVFLLSPEGKKVARLGYSPGGAAPYIKNLRQLIAQAEG